MRTALRRSTLALTVVGLSAYLAACGGDSSSSADSVSQVGTAVQVSPFASIAQFAGTGLAGITTVSFTIAPRAGALAQPVHVTYSADALRQRGDLDAASTLLIASINIVRITKNFNNEL